MLVLFVALVALVPLAVFPLTIDLLEINKQTLLLVGVSLLSLVWLVRIVRSHSLTVRYGMVMIPPALFVVGLFVSALQSSAKYLSFVGESTQEYESALTAVAGFVLFFLLAQCIRTPKEYRVLLFSLVISAVIVGLASALQMIGIPVFVWAGESGRVFNTIGSMSAVAFFLTLVAFIGQALLLLDARAKYRFWEKGLVHLLGLVAIFHLFVLDASLLWLFLLIGSVLTMILVMRASVSSVIGIVSAILFLIIPTPFSLSLPVEVLPSASASWEIVKQTLGDEQVSSLFGSGPGTFVFDYAKAHSAELNTSAFWNVRFDRGFSHLFTLLATTGVVGIVLVLLFFFHLVARTVRSSVFREERPISGLVGTLLLGLVLLFVLLLLTSFNMTLVLLLWMISGLLVSALPLSERTYHFRQSRRLAMIMTILLVLTSVYFMTLLTVSGQRYVAEVAYAKGLQSTTSTVTLDKATRLFNQSASLNRWSDIAYRALAQTLLTRVEDELAQEAIPQERMFYVQALIAGAVEASKRAVELSPRNVANWETRGAVYQAIADVVDGADAFAIDAYRMAHELEPASPVHLTNLAKSYHAFARRTAILASSSDEAFAEAVQIQVDENLRQAESALLRAIELKADYAPAHYEISIVYEEQGRLAEALAKMESVKRYNPFDVGVAFQLGVLYLRQGKNDLAQMEFERAVELVPTFVNAHWYLASVYELKGDIEAAAFEVAIVLDLDPDNEAVKAKLARLQDGLSIAEVPEPIENSP